MSALRPGRWPRGTPVGGADASRGEASGGRGLPVRLVFAVGSWQTLTAVTSLSAHDEASPGRRRDVLVLHGVGIRPADVPVLTALGRRLWPWASVVDATDLLTDARLAEEGCDRLAAALAERLGLARADEVWVCSMEHPLAKTMVDGFSPRAAYLFEDGLETYLPKKSTCGAFRWGPRGLRSGARALAHRLGYRAPAQCLLRAGLCQSVAGRFRAAYLNYADRIPVPRHLRRLRLETVGWRRLLSALECASGMPTYGDFLARWPAPAPGAFLLLGQPFADWKQLTPEEERDAFAQAARRIIESGYTVAWKEHPRTQRPLGPVLRSLFGDAVLCLEGGSAFWPVEMLHPHFRFAGAAGVTSTALINLNGLYGVPCFTLERSIPRWPSESLRHQAALVRDAVPPLEALPTRRDG